MGVGKSLENTSQLHLHAVFCNCSQTVLLAVALRSWHHITTSLHKSTACIRALPRCTAYGQSF